MEWWPDFLQKGGGMSSIQVKGINDYLLFILSDEVSDDQCLEDLEKLLCSPSFQKENFYVKGYFDFGNRKFNRPLFEQLMVVLKKTHVVLFCGVSGRTEEKRRLNHFSGIIRNGEVYTSSEDLLFEGKINPGGHLVVHGRTYVIGKCLGMIEVLGKDASINASDLRHASLKINENRIEDVSVDRLTVFFEDSGQIRCMREDDNVWQERL